MRDDSGVDPIFHALAEPTRRAIVERLSLGPASVSELAQPFGVSLAAIVQHLQVLERSGVVQTQKVGRVRTCLIRQEGLDRASNWIDERRTLWENRFDRLGEVLAETDDNLIKRKKT
ncbi:MAG: metalloregulator ArsR/SmtB family transcription factor [Burkholderiaceae bacterium]